MRTVQAVLAGVVAVGLAGTAGATIVNLTTLNSAGALNDGLFVQGSTEPSGTGVFGTFLKLKQGGNVTHTQGYNTGAVSKPLDDNHADTHTHEILLSDVPLFNCGPGISGCTAGEQYRQFQLDINNKGSDPLMSLRRVILWQLPHFDETDATAVQNQLFGADNGTGGNPLLFSDVPGGKVYDSGQGNSVLLNYDLASGGSGHSDMFLYVPDKDFVSNSFVYLYSEFGIFPTDALQSDKTDAHSCTVTLAHKKVTSSDNCGGVPQGANAGFEEWAVGPPTGIIRGGGGPSGGPVPEPASIVLFGSSLLGLAAWGRKRVAR